MLNDFLYLFECYLQQLFLSHIVGFGRIRTKIAGWMFGTTPGEEKELNSRQSFHDMKSFEELWSDVGRQIFISNGSDGRKT